MRNKEMVSVLVLIEPHIGHDTEEILTLLQTLGAENISVLVHGFISARLPRSKIVTIRSIAHIDEKREKKLLAGR